MYRGLRILALIPARGGSKGLPRKNILPLHGKPLIAWTIEAALQCDFLDYVVVSTDDQEIRDISIEYGAAVPFLRPAELATDTAGSLQTVFHAINWLEEHQQYFDLILLLQPTSPLRSSDHIRQAVELYTLKDAGCIVSVCEVDHHPFWMNTLPADGNMSEFLNTQFQNIPRQKLPRYYRVNGALYLAGIEGLRRKQSFFSKRTFAFLMGKEDSVDIDDRLDFDLASLILQRKQVNGKTVLTKDE